MIPGILARAAVFALAMGAACTARHFVVPDPAVPGGAADYGAAVLQVRSFEIAGGGDADSAPSIAPQLRAAFAEYVLSKCRFRDVRYGKDAGAGPAISVDVAVSAAHSSYRTWVLDAVGVHLLWPLVPQWGAAHVTVSLAAKDPQDLAWSTQAEGSAPYSMFFYSWWRTAPVEAAYRSAYSQAFQKAASAFCADRHTQRVAQRAASPTAVPASASAPGGRLAVLDFKNFARDLQAENIQYFTDLVRGVVLKGAPRFSVITRENLLVLLQSTGKDLAACEGECEVDTGRRIGADVIVSGDIQRVGTRYKISLRMHDTRDGRLLSTAIASGASVDALDDAATRAADELLAPLR